MREIYKILITIDKNHKPLDFRAFVVCWKHEFAYYSIEANKCQIGDGRKIKRIKYDPPTETEPELF